jgi:hypothetical protein
MIARSDIHRDALYSEVWQAPMIEVGKKYGVSRPTVKWACTQMGVPLPPQSYWTHLAHDLKYRAAAAPAAPCESTADN